MGVMGYRRKGWAAPCLHFCCSSVSLGLAQILPLKGKKINVLMVGKCWWPECSWGCNDVRAFLTSSLVFLPQRQCQIILCQCNKPRISATILNVGNLLKNNSFHIRKFCWQRGKQTLPFANAWEISCVSFFWSALAVLLGLSADTETLAQRK